jgi:hypothetical protein
MEVVRLPGIVETGEEYFCPKKAERPSKVEELRFQSWPSFSILLPQKQNDEKAE